jgi:hypothetical protein
MDNVSLFLAICLCFTCCVLSVVTAFAYKKHSEATKQLAQQAKPCPGSNQPACPDATGLLQYRITGTPRNPASAGLVKTFASLSTATQRLLCVLLREAIKSDEQRRVPFIKASQTMARISQTVEGARTLASNMPPLANNQALTSIVINTYESLMTQAMTAVTRPEYTTAEQQQAALKDIILDISDMMCPFTDLGFPLSRDGK